MIQLPTSAATEGAFSDLVEALAPRGVVRGAMFGMPALKAGSKAFAGVFGDAVVFKLTGPAHAAAAALKGASLFDPSGMGRAMKEWVVVPLAHAARWGALAESALEYADATVKPASKKAVSKKAPVAAKGASKKPASKTKKSAS
jgi:hypothetical protein